MTGAEWAAFAIGAMIFIAVGIFGWALSRH
jgi:hypothetical protein